MSKKRNQEIIKSIPFSLYQMEKNLSNTISREKAKKFGGNQDLIQELSEKLNQVKIKRNG